MNHVCQGEWDCFMTYKFWVDSRYSLRGMEAKPYTVMVSGFGSGGDMAQNYFILYNNDTTGLGIYPSKYDTLLRQKK